MSAPVPESRVNLVDLGILIGYSVRGVPWIHASRLHNWVAGRGYPLVPDHAPLVIIAGSGTSEFYYRVRVRYQTTRLRFSILLTTSSESSTCQVQIPPGTAQGGSFTVFNRKRATPVVFDVDLSYQADEETTLSLKILNTGAANVIVEGIHVEALPRAFLVAQDPNDLGSNRLAFWHRQPISERNFALNLLDLQSVLKRSARRAMFQHSWGSDAPWSTAVAGPTAVFDDKFGLIGRALYEGDTTRELSWRVRARCSDGSTAGEVTLTNTGAGSASSTITIPAGSTAGSFFPPVADDPAVFDCDAEDVTDSWGLRGSAVDEHQITVTRTAGSGTIYLETISIWEAPDAAPPAPTYTLVTDDDEPYLTDDDDNFIAD